MSIQVKIRTIYGVEKIYPVCDKAKLFASIAGQTTLTRQTIQGIKSLGYEIKVIHNEVSL